MSTTAQFCVSWMSYRNCISKGFSQLQQNGEFVDMTLAADGHLVKVHQNIVALASPYLKAMIQSTQCQHPVVFLNNVSQEMLSFVLEYIYTGEVKIPTDSIPCFIEICKALYINGVENLDLPQKPETVPPKPDALDRPIYPADNNFAAHIKINSFNYDVEVIPVDNKTTEKDPNPDIALENEITNYHVLPVVIENKINPGHENSLPNISVEETDFDLLSNPIVEKEDNPTNIVIDSDYNATVRTTGQNLRNVILNLSMKNVPSHKSDKTISPSIDDRDRTQHYSISNRGSLQLLLNRFMYHCHHNSCGGRKRRWRCVDYRKTHCPAFVDTDNDSIVNRSEIHTHANHDAKIMRKFKTKTVFTSLCQAQDNALQKPSRGRSKKRVVQSIEGT